MPSIDERVVSMAFENQVFEQRVAVTMASLGKLNDAIAKTGTQSGLSNIERDANKVTLQGPMSALDKLKAKLGQSGQGAAEGFNEIERAGNKVTLEGPSSALDKLRSKFGRGVAPEAINSFSDIEKAASGVSLEGISRAIDSVSGKFSVLAGAASVALGNITSQAIAKGASFAKSFGVGPIIDGLHEYQTNLQAIQTVQANTDQPLTKINASLAELNKYSDQTIYNFGEMAKNVGTFTAAGVDLKTSVSSIKGIANLAALSGSSSQQAATAMYQLSQAISSGRVGLQDWNSVVNAGMGGKKLQNALAQTATAMGGLNESSVKLVGPMKKLTINGQSFRESIQAKPGQKPWLTSEVLVNTLATLDGRFSKAALSAELTKDGLKKYTAAQIEAKIAASRLALEQKNGVKYTDAQFKALMHLSDSAFKSATEVKTLGQVFDIAKETIGSGWSASFQSIFGNLKEAKQLFTGMSNTINGFINANALARNTVLHDWKALGGRTALIDGLKNAFQALMAIIKPIGQAFREVFPRKTGQDLATMTKQFRDLMASLKIGPQTAENLKRTFAGLFAVFHIGWTIVKDLGKVIFDLLGIVGKGSGGFLNFTGGIGDFLVAIDKAVSKGHALDGFFKGLENVLRIPIDLIHGLASGLNGLFKPHGAGFGQDAKEIEKFGKVLTPFERIANRVKDAWNQLTKVFDKVSAVLQPLFDKVKSAVSTIGDAIAEGIKGANFDKVTAAIQTTFIGGIFLTIKKAISGGKTFDITGGALKNLSEGIKALTGNLTAMQKQIQAATIFTIAAAVLALAAGVKILSTINAKQLSIAMTAIAVGLGELAGALKIMSVGGIGGAAEMTVIATAMFILAGAVIILAGAVKIFSTMNWDQLGRGLAGVAGSMLAIGVGMKAIGAVRLLPIAAGLLLVGVALNIIAVAVKQFSQMKWEDLAKGLLGMGGALLVLAGGLALIGPSVLLVGPGLIAASIGMTILAGAVSAFSAIDPKKMLSGILGLGLALSALGLALAFIPPTAAISGAGLIVAAAGITVLAGAIGILGKMKIGTLLKGIIAMGGALVVLGTGLVFMEATLPGAAALLVAAGAFAILGPAIGFLGTLSWGTILKGLAAIALTMGVFAGVGALAAPALTALGLALLLVGGAAVLVGTGILLAAKGISLISGEGAKGLATLVAAIGAFIALLPSMIINFVKGLVAIVEEVAKVAPKVVLALGVILDTVIAFIIESAPKFAVAVNALITAILDVLAQNAQPMIDAGWRLIQQLLTGVSNNIGSVVTKVGDVITNFLNAFISQAPRIVQAGARVLGSFLGGIATALPTVIASAARVIGKFLEGVTAQLPSVITKGAKLIITFLNEIIKHVPEFVRAGTRLIIAVINGIGNALDNIINAGVRIVKKLMNGIAQAVPDLVDSGYRAVIRLINGLARAIRENNQALIDAGFNLADAIIDGMVSGFKQLAGRAVDGIKGLIGSLPKAARKLLGALSPSKVFAAIGKDTVLGLTQGFDENHKPVIDAVSGVGDDATKAITKSLSNISDRVGSEIDTDLTITPVLDLSQVQKDAGKMQDLTNVVPITAAASFGHAVTISTDTATTAEQTAAAAQTGPSFRFEQNNYSPESLSDVEIYRRTNNQLAQVQRSLGLIGLNSA